MPGVFAHRSPLPRESNYQNYRAEIREDFHGCCAYCLLHEVFAGGVENFELDHFKPKSKFAHLEKVYTNIYYTCHVCNHKKSDHWPSSELFREGRRFVDTCEEKHSNHFSLKQDGYWQPLTLAGEYTVEKLGLNREHLVTIRKELDHIASQKGLPSINWDEPTKEQIALLLES